jgi:hypothetical protein
VLGNPVCDSVASWLSRPESSESFISCYDVNAKIKQRLAGRNTADRESCTAVSGDFGQA